MDLNKKVQCALETQGIHNALFYCEKCANLKKQIDEKEKLLQEVNYKYIKQLEQSDQKIKKLEEQNQALQTEVKTLKDEIKTLKDENKFKTEQIERQELMNKRADLIQKIYELIALNLNYESWTHLVNARTQLYRQKKLNEIAQLQNKIDQEALNLGFTQNQWSALSNQKQAHNSSQYSLATTDGSIAQKTSSDSQDLADALQHSWDIAINEVYLWI